MLSQLVIDRTTEQLAVWPTMQRRPARLSLINQFVHDLSGRGIVFLLRHRDCLLDNALMPDVQPGRIPLSGVLSPLGQREIVREPEQRSTDSQLVFVAWRVNNHHTGRYQPKA